MAGHIKTASIHERLFVLDLDRCLITGQAYTILDEVVAESGIVDLSLFTEARLACEASGGSFDSMAWLMTQEGFDKLQYGLLLNQYITRAKQLGNDALLAPGARSLLTSLQRMEVPHVIMTFGGYANQLAKLKAANLENEPHIIVDHKNKALYIAEWWDEMAGVYSIKLDNYPVKARGIVLVDDKAAAFTNLENVSQVRGYWVRAEHLLTSQEGEIPPNVRPIKSLQKIIEYEKLG